MKTKKGLSNFHWDIIVLLIFALVIVCSFKLKLFTSLFPNDWGFPIWVVRGIILVFLFSKLILIHSNLDDSLNIAYKIFKIKHITEHGEYYTYKARVLKPWFLFLIWWQPVKKKDESWEGKNLFGGPIYGGYSYEKIFKSEEKARAAINTYKYWARSQIEYYFERPYRAIEKINI